ncbi:MAG TPA: glycerol-3-phosphate dehydrogenase/oxidase [Longimicrobiales bacterium]|nr:glycerol-3-phosphate dehydrogenase/oxidase [Longimicrobiales bacterium]
MNRAEMVTRLGERREPWDMLVIGGGATGVGIAVDAASRGYAVALVEQADFGKGTSSRSTKLVHGGVRYLQQGNIPLVMEALKERGILRRNAPHLVRDLPFVVPNYQWWEAPFYGIGMKVYDALAGRYGFGSSANLTVEETVARIPTIETEGLRGGVQYHDGQFDDARLLIHLVRTAAEQGAVVVNYARVTGLVRDSRGFLEGARVRDEETGEERAVPARLVVNATGAFSDAIRRMDDPDATPMVRPSQGVHVVLPREFLPGEAAIMVPHTDDGRVLFAIPWHERVIVGTTDTPLDDVELEPRPLREEVDFLLEHAVRYLTRDPAHEDILSVFAGIRPLVAAQEASEGDTSKISREHQIHVSSSGLMTVAGGKWTTYRKMAEDAVDHGAVLAGLEPRECVTKNLNIHGHHAHADRFGPLALYGADAPALQALLDEDPDMGAMLHPRLPVRVGEIVWAARHEMARTVDDALARRTRCLILDARAAAEAAPAAARVLARELGRGPGWFDEQVEAFTALAARYLPEA